MKNQGLILFGLTIVAVYLYYLPLPNNNDIDEFTAYKHQFAKTYSLEEESYRFAIFRKNVKKILEHNADKTQTYLMGINQFTDMTQEEFIQKILIKNLPGRNQVSVSSPSTVSNIPDEWDWRGKNVLTQVKNQGGCGSCWAFSVTGTLQSAIAISKNQLYDLSEQQLVDCCGSKGYECLGCSGAWPEWAFNYISKEGIVLQTEYKYAGVNQNCKTTPTAQKFLNSVNPSSFISFNQPECSNLKKALSEAPVSVCLDASNWSAYRSGVFNNCGTTNLNHAVLLVAYDSSGVWTIKNSWAATWGEQGFMRLAKGNTCGLATHALSVNLA